MFLGEHFSTKPTRDLKISTESLRDLPVWFVFEIYEICIYNVYMYIYIYMCVYVYMCIRVTCDIFVFGDSFGAERPLCECVGMCRARSTTAMAHKNVEGLADYGGL